MQESGSEQLRNAVGFRNGYMQYCNSAWMLTRNLIKCGCVCFCACVGTFG